MYFVGNSEKPFSTDLLIEAVTEMPTSGYSKHRLLAMGALTHISQQSAVHQWETQSYWGEVQRRGYITATELTIDCFHFSVIDFRIPSHYRMP